MVVLPLSPNLADLVEWNAPVEWRMGAAKICQTFPEDSTLVLYTQLIQTFSFKTNVWDFAVQTLGLQQGSFSRLFLMESLSLEYSDCP